MKKLARDFVEFVWFLFLMGLIGMGLMVGVMVLRAALDIAYVITTGKHIRQAPPEDGERPMINGYGPSGD